MVSLVHVLSNIQCLVQVPVVWASRLCIFHARRLAWLCWHCVLCCVNLFAGLVQDEEEDEFEEPEGAEFEDMPEASDEDIMDDEFVGMDDDDEDVEADDEDLDTVAGGQCIVLPCINPWHPVQSSHLYFCLLGSGTATNQLFSDGEDGNDDEDDDESDADDDDDDDDDERLDVRLYIPPSHFAKTKPRSAMGEGQQFTVQTLSTAA